MQSSGFSIQRPFFFFLGFSTFLFFLIFFNFFWRGFLFLWSIQRIQSQNPQDALDCFARINSQKKNPLDRGKKKRTVKSSGIQWIVNPENPEKKERALRMKNMKSMIFRKNSAGGWQECIIILHSSNFF